MSSPTIILGVLGGLVLFLFGVFQLASAIEPLANDRARALLGRFTTNPLAAVVTGIVATTILDSSSVTIIVVIALVNGGLLTFKQSLGVIMGSNIGTTISSQIFALDVEQYHQSCCWLGSCYSSPHVGSTGAVTPGWRCLALAWCSSGCITSASHRAVTRSQGVHAVHDGP